MNKAIGLILITLILSFSNLFAGAALTSAGTPKAVPTFECIGLTIPFSGDDNLNSTCSMQYKKAGSSVWKTGHSLFRCPQKREYRGSIVHLQPNTSYDVRVTCQDPDGGEVVKNCVQKTWNEVFPEGKVTTITNMNSTLQITESGSAGAYRVFEGPKGGMGLVDAQSKHSNCIYIAANYVIIRRLKITQSATNAIVIAANCHDVVIEDCEIYNWGQTGPVGTLRYGKNTGIYVKAATERVIIQRNDIHHPKGNTNSWAQYCESRKSYHPAGPQAISFMQTNGNHVIRYNRMRSGAGHYYNDVLGGGSNSGSGNLRRDSDVYGNEVSHAFDDGLEVEGSNINIRIWGNLIHHVNMGVATSSTLQVGGKNWVCSNAYGSILGPTYVWRNVFYELWNIDPQFAPSWEVDPKPGRATKIGSRGAYYFYHNTLLRVGSNRIYVGVQVQAVGENITVLNNILDATLPFHSNFRSSAKGSSTCPIVGPPVGNWADYNLFRIGRGGMECERDYSICSQLKPEWEMHGTFRTIPVYNKVGDSHYLRDKHPGIDKGCIIPNFSDIYSGLAPDPGACEKGAFALRVGPDGSVAPEIRSRAPQEKRGIDSRVLAFSVSQASIRYTLGEKENVNLEIRDSKGGLVKTLVSRTMSPGVHRQNLSVEGLASGLYFFHLTAGKHWAAARLLCVR